MKNLFFSAIFAIIAITSNAQVVTISGFGTKEKFGPVASKTEFVDILFDDFEASPSEEVPTSFKYVIDFNSKQCTLFDATNQKVESVSFVIIYKKSDRDFQIEFTTSDNDDSYGIIVKGNTAAYTQFNGQAVALYIFDASYIF